MVGLLRTCSVVLVGFAATVLLCLLSSQARCTPRDEDLFLRPEDMNTVLFGSLDAGRSTFLNAGVKRTLTGPLDRPGFVAMQTNGIGLDRERFGSDPGVKVTRITTEASGMLGYQWMPFGVYVALFAGPELHQEQLTVAAAAGRWSEPRIGFRGQAELWANPTRDTLVNGTLVAGTTRGSVWARASAGVRIWRDVFVGPEAIVYTTDTYRETKLGVHLTGIDLGIIHLRVSAGVQTQSGLRGGAAYLALTTWVRM